MEAQLPSEVCHYAALLAMAAANVGCDKAAWQSSGMFGVFFMQEERFHHNPRPQSASVKAASCYQGRVILAKMQDLADV